MIISAGEGTLNRASSCWAVGDYRRLLLDIVPPGYEFATMADFGAGRRHISSCHDSGFESFDAVEMAEVDPELHTYESRLCTRWATA